PSAIFISSPLHSLAIPAFPTRRSSDLEELSGRVEALDAHPGIADDHGLGDVAADPRGQLPELRGVPGQVPERDLARLPALPQHRDRKSTRLNSSPVKTSYADFCLKNKN